MKTHIPIAVISTMEIATPLKAKEAVSHFTIAELSRSTIALRHGIDNTPPPEAVLNMQRLIDNVLEPARNLLQKQIIVNSGYRCPRLNSMVGGAKRSYHLSGRAADITTGNIDDNRRLLEILSQLPHVELISEHGGLWIHVAF